MVPFVAPIHSGFGSFELKKALRRSLNWLIIWETSDHLEADGKRRSKENAQRAGHPQQPQPEKTAPRPRGFDSVSFRLRLLDSCAVTWIHRDKKSPGPCGCPALPPARAHRQRQSACLLRCSGNWCMHREHHMRGFPQIGLMVTQIRACDFPNEAQRAV